MTLIRWDPFRNAYILEDHINRLFDDAFPGTKTSRDEIRKGAWRPPVDIFETRRSIVICAELPGINKEDVSVDVNGSILILKGERRVNPEVDDDLYFRRERKSGPFHRSFTLPVEIDTDGIAARFKDGVLEIELPRQKIIAPKTVSVKCG
jgi:HSP20 family protein